MIEYEVYAIKATCKYKCVCGECLGVFPLLVRVRIIMCGGCLGINLVVMFRYVVIVGH